MNVGGVPPGSLCGGVDETNHLRRKPLACRVLGTSTQSHRGEGRVDVCFSFVADSRWFTDQSSGFVAIRCADFIGFKEATGCRNGCHYSSNGRLAAPGIDSHAEPAEVESVCHRAAPLSLFNCAPTRPINMQTILNKIPSRMTKLRHIQEAKGLTNSGVKLVAPRKPARCGQCTPGHSRAVLFSSAWTSF